MAHSRIRVGTYKLSPGHLALQIVEHVHAGRPRGQGQDSLSHRPIVLYWVTVYTVWEAR